MLYKQLSIVIDDAGISDIIIAKLSAIGFDGFEETDETLFAYVPNPDFDEIEVARILSAYRLSYKVKDIEEQNWNAQWEESFQPVIVPGFCTVRAHFHDVVVTTPHEIIITPQMSFGTGHHATTMLMMMQMQHMEMVGKSVLDFGTGTGILAILAEQLKAQKVIAIDNDSWSYDNAIENAKRNNCTSVSVFHGSLEDLPKGQFDIILANINRHILVDYMKSLYEILVPGGKILMSGLLNDDFNIIKTTADKAGFNIANMEELNGWIALLFKK